MSEITPRTDDAHQQDDIFVTVHKNLRDATWSMFRDNKHIHEFKIPKFAANIIRALKMAYNIKDKRFLCEKDKIFHQNHEKSHKIIHFAKS